MANEDIPDLGKVRKWLSGAPSRARLFLPAINIPDHAGRLARDGSQAVECGRFKL